MTTDQEIQGMIEELRQRVRPASVSDKLEAGQRDLVEFSWELFTDASLSPESVVILDQVSQQAGQGKKLNRVVDANGDFVPRSGSLSDDEKLLFVAGMLYWCSQSDDSEAAERGFMFALINASLTLLDQVLDSGEQALHCKLVDWSRQELERAGDSLVL